MRSRRPTRAQAAGAAAFPVGAEVAAAVAAEVLASRDMSDAAIWRSARVRGNLKRMLTDDAVRVIVEALFDIRTRASKDQSDTRRRGRE